MSVNYALATVVILGATAAIWKGSDWLETTSAQLSAYYGLPMVVQGAIVTAVGSSFPELASVVFAGLAGSLELGVGAIVGSAIFNILVIPGVAGVAAETPVEASRTLVYKEAQFYMLAVSVLLITFALGVIYYPVAGERLHGEVTRPLALIPLALYGLYIFIQYQDTSDHDTELDRDGIDIRRQWAYLLASLAVILVAVEQLVGQVEAIGVELGVSQFLLGVTIIAAATSLPDTLVSVRAARAGRGVVSMANVLGSNTFDLLVAIPVGIMLVGATAIDFAMAVPMFGALTGATILLFALLRTDMVLTETESYVLVGAYFLFVAWVLVEVTRIVPGVLPA
ncbi:sodium:calcium antiporter [Salinibaculum rarum]|uniref:sodium:calcium antiporter n=1 Tax=Salinibaculum rarum TaxID=3058903 RepID=UPI00265EA707|nr:sodium:calcium antiporter [Salinibaculum sp. KK48]